MVNNRYAKAYTEVLEIIKYFPQDEYLRIPQEVINYYRNNMDIDYEFTIDPKIPLENQNVSIEAFAIIVTLFRDYFATDKQKDTLKNLLKQNQQKKDEELAEKYNPDNMFKDTKHKEEVVAEESTSMTVYKESIITKIWSFIKNIFKK